MRSIFSIYLTLLQCIIGISALLTLLVAIEKIQRDVSHVKLNAFFSESVSGLAFLLILLIATVAHYSIKNFDARIKQLEARAKNHP